MCTSRSCMQTSAPSFLDVRPEGVCPSALYQPRRRRWTTATICRKEFFLARRERKITARVRTIHRGKKNLNVI
ncbi:hypothetical protein PUN28_011678 [Cardiocondyla obscurior]|uniref:Ribosomal protein L34 n=1 Tax=Cardiocondyla obscurior TaxID=286306 RepID=A0AAW2FGE9_9HYME